MMLKDGMLLYHGSYTKVENVDLSKSGNYKDFGKGFYLTSNKSQAINFIKTSLKKGKQIGDVPENQNYGYVSVFRYHELQDKINSYDFERSSKIWLWFIAANRRQRLAKELIPLIDKDIFEAEIVSGKIANDTTNPVLQAYLTGLYGDIKSDRAIRFAIEELVPDHLYDQFCFKTEKAIGCLEFVEAERYGV